MVEPLKEMLGQLKNKQTKEREASKERAAKNRKNGYVWKSSYHPKRSKYKKEENDDT